MMKVLIPTRSGGQVVDVEAVAGCHWEGKGEGRALFIHYVGGRFEKFEGEAAEALFRVIAGEASALELQGR